MLALCLVATMVQAHYGHSPFDAPGIRWQLIEIDGKPFPANVLLEFPGIGSLTGEAPCKRFHAEIWSACPWFQPGRIAATRRACPDLAAEAQFFAALQAMTLAEADDKFLILTGENPNAMVFSRVPAGE